MKIEKPEAGTIERRFNAGTVQIMQAAPETRASVAGVAAVIGRNSPDLGGFIERIEPGAFDDAEMTDVVALFNHDRNLLLGRTSAGTASVSIRDDGLHYAIDLPDTSYANDLRASLDRGDVTQSSFAFSIAEDNWEDLDGMLLRSITRIARVYDVSPVTEPAYPQTSVALRSLDQWRESHQKPKQRDGSGLLRLARASLNLRKRL